MVGTFDGARLSSDSGILLLREADRLFDVTGRLAACFLTIAIQRGSSIASRPWSRSGCWVWRPAMRIYDLGKLRAHRFAERAGTSRRYRLNADRVGLGALRRTIRGLRHRAATIPAPSKRHSAPFLGQTLGLTAA